MEQKQLDALVRYVDAATDLAESVKDAIELGAGELNNDVVDALNEFIVAAYAIENFTNDLQSRKLN